MRSKLLLFIILAGVFSSCVKEMEGDNASIEIVLDSITPAVARIGDTVTLFGHDFSGLSSPSITINDDSTEVIEKASDQIKFIVRFKFKSGTVRLINNSQPIDGPSIGYRYIANVTTVAGTGSAGSNDGSGASAEFKCPWGLAIDKQGNLLVADSYNRLIRKIDFTNYPEPYVTSVSPGTNNFYSPYNITVDTVSNTTFVTDFNSHILRIDDQGVQTVIYDYPTLKATTGIAIGPDRMVYISDNINHRIFKMDQDGANESDITMSVFTPRNLVFDKEGRLYTINSHVMEVMQDGSLHHFEQEELLQGWEFAIDDQGDFYEADHVNNRIQKVDRQTGKITVIAGGGIAKDVDGIGLQAGFNGPMSLVFDKEGNLYVSTYNFDTNEGNKIRKITFE